MEKPRKLLIFRFSSLGDVAMTVPVIQLLLKQYPGLEIIFISNPFVAPLFKNIERLHFYPVDLKGKHAFEINVGLIDGYCLELHFH